MGWNPVKAVKKVAKKIKKMGSRAWRSVKKGVGKLMGTLMKPFGKYGPLVMLALSFYGPGLSSMVGNLWNSTAASLGSAEAGAFANAISKGMTAISEGASAISTTASNITTKIGENLTKLGGTVSDGANALFKGAQEFASVKDPMSVKDVGNWVSNKAKEFVGGPDTATKANRVFSANPELRSAMNAQARAAVEKGTSLLGEEGVASEFAANRFGTNVGIDVSQAGVGQGTAVSSTDIMNQQAANLFDTTAGRAGPPVPSDGSFTNKALKAVGKALLTPTEPLTPTIVPIPQAFTTDVAQTFNRGLVGGTGSGGGQFLSQAQLAQQDAFRRKLMELA